MPHRARHTTIGGLLAKRARGEPWTPREEEIMASKRSQPRSLYGTAKVIGDPQAQEARLALAEAGQGGERRHGPEETQADVGLKRLVTEPGETWVLETEQAEDVAMKALGTWGAAHGVFVIVFGAGERFSCLSTQPGDTIVLHTAHPENLNQQALGQWAGQRGLALAVLPPDISVQQLDDATLDQMHLMRKPQGLIIPGAGQVLGGNGR